MNDFLRDTSPCPMTKCAQAIAVVIKQIRLMRVVIQYKELKLEAVMLGFWSIWANAHACLWLNQRDVYRCSTFKLVPRT